MFSLLMTSLSDAKVSIFIPSLLGGGAERVMVTLANELVSNNIDLDLVVVNATGPYLDEVAPKVNVVDLGSKKIIFSIFKLVKYLRKQRPTTVLTALGSVNVVAIIAKIISRVPFKLVISERAVASVAIADNPDLRAKILSVLMKITYPMADAIVAVSQGVADDLIENYGISSNKIKVIYNPVVTKSLGLLSEEAFENPYFDHKKFPMILGVGRLTSQKDFPALIHAFSFLLEHYEARLVILGDGGLLDNLVMLTKRLDIEDKVFFPGFVSNPYVWMKHAKLFVLSSAYEGLPNVLIQAMACGTPVVSTDCPSGPREILEGGKWGRLSPVGDSKLLMQAMLTSLQGDTHPNVKHRANDFFVDKAVLKYKEIIQ